MDERAGAAGGRGTPDGVRALLGAAAAFALALLCVATVLLWQLLDETRKDNRAAGAGAGGAEQAPLPPPTRGGKSLAQQVDRSTSALRSELRAANLRSLEPLLERVTHDTAAFPRAAEDLAQLAQQASALGGLRDSVDLLLPALEPLGETTGSLASLNENVGLAARTLAPTNENLAATSGALSRADRTLTGTNTTLTHTADTLEQLLPAIRDLNATLTDAKRSLDRTNACLERPVVCQAESR
ncbi:MAG TPA: hypothetical protein VF712_10490 [Thermoleophilaceae bacterium]